MIRTNLRELRLRHGLSLVALSRAAGLSTQYVSRAELGLIPPTPRLEQQMDRALESVIRAQQEKARLLEEDYLTCRGPGASFLHLLSAPACNAQNSRDPVHPGPSGRLRPHRHQR